MRADYCGRDSALGFSNDTVGRTNALSGGVRGDRLLANHGTAEFLLVLARS